MTHSPDCLAHNANTLFGEPHCICAPKYLTRTTPADLSPIKPLLTQKL